MTQQLNYFLLIIGNIPTISSMLSIIIAALGIIFLVLYFYKKQRDPVKMIVEPASVEQEKNLGQIQVFYASQTGTAAKMASMFAEEAAQQGFNGVVIDLKNISHSEFHKNQISVFFMANTGEGEPPENSVAFMKLLSGKQQLEGEVPDWKNMNYVVFGLGDTQYEHFNKIGIDTDKALSKLGANRLQQICLGDANCSLEDDYVEWKNKVWDVLKNYRLKNPMIEGDTVKNVVHHRKQSSGDIRFLSEKAPIYANFRFVMVQEQIQPQQEEKVNENELDFKTKASLLGKISGVEGIIQKRQDTKNGSSLQLQIVLPGQPEYQTASNIALWPQNDPTIVQQIIKYFNLLPETVLEIDVIDANKKNKFNFVAPVTIRDLLNNYLDVQFRITKGLLKKLSKFESKSPQYFLNNSSPKTTEEYKRISQQGQFCYLFKLIKEYQVAMSFQDFVEISDSMGPRLFTIASSWKAQKNVIIIASIVDNGLISKNFNRNPSQMKAELRKSSFGDIFGWKKVIFIGAGTGFAPFRGYLQQKQLAKKEGKQAPIISLYFGCKYKNSDFIYREEMMQWQKNQVINKLNLAFSRQNEQKVYVQNLLESNTEELKQFIGSQEQSMYICGSVGMGKDVSRVLEEAIQKNLGKSQQQSKELMAGWQKSGKFIKELW